MAIGRVIDTPNQISGFGRVRNEYGGEHTVHASTLAGLEEGDEFAYHVVIWQHDSGNVTTLAPGTYGAED